MPNKFCIYAFTKYFVLSAKCLRDAITRNAKCVQRAQIKDAHIPCVAFIPWVAFKDIRKFLTLQGPLEESK